jgi:hypothetical protein
VPKNGLLELQIGLLEELHGDGQTHSSHAGVHRLAPLQGKGRDQLGSKLLRFSLDRFLPVCFDLRRFLFTLGSLFGPRLLGVGDLGVRALIGIFALIICHGKPTKKNDAARLNG